MLTTITGPMYAGKTSELLRHYFNLQVAGENCLLIKPDIDTRYAVDSVVTHNNSKIPCVVLPHNTQPLDFAVPLPSRLHVLVDETQFFQEPFVRHLYELSEAGIRVICATLACDFRGIPFFATEFLLPRSDQIIHLKAVCSDCSSIESATRTFKMNADGDSPRIEVGGTEQYLALCPNCWSKREINDHKDRCSERQCE